MCESGVCWRFSQSAANGSVWAATWLLKPLLLRHNERISGEQTVRTSSKLQTHTFIWRFGSINRGRGERAEHRSDPNEELNTRNSKLAPTISGSIISREQLPLSNKLRKPIVEKIRRERINSSIEKLKSLLGQEFLKQQPDSRQEKAEILEMTLDFLRRQQRSQNPSACSSTAARDGRSRCVQEAVNLLSQCPVQTESHRRLLKHFLHMQPYTENNTRVPPQLNSPAAQSSSKEQTLELWRPW
ncbi:transcription factor HES-5-like [Sinocyclocheilus rhinocerous]|uniref:transcription factor HES-5-like n=1 Tax=Sinocyclocheilus rhinocerous TaxID=307959 RepID=UPI0007B95AD0|nr:PREDICTED: transcription factor HES-5-like [Sinocyclocheilus rhinocerous]